MSGANNQIDITAHRRVLLYFCLISGCFYFAAAWYQWTQARPLMALVNAASAAALLLACVLFRRLDWLHSATMLGIWAAVMNVGLLTAVTGASAIAILTQVPVIGLSAAYLLDEIQFRRVILALLVITLLGVIWPATGLSSPEHVPPAATVRFLQILEPAMLVLMWITAISFRSASSKLIQSLNEAIVAKDKEVAQAEYHRLRAEDLIRIASDGFWETDAAGKLTLVSSPIATRLGLRESDILGKHPLEAYRELTPDYKEAEAGKVAVAMQRGLLLKDQRLQLKDRKGRGHLFIVSGRPWHNADGSFGGYRGLFRDESDNERRNRAVQRLAETDPLTGAFNRRAFDKWLKDVVENDALVESGVWAAYMDLDGFKLLNDTDGHAAGDRLLTQFATCLKANSPESSLIARMGGDEFCVVLFGLSELQAKIWAESILSEFSTLSWKNRSAVSVGVSIGLARLSATNIDPDWWLQQADEAAYEAKRTGGSCYRVRHV